VVFAQTSILQPLTYLCIMPSFTDQLGATVSLPGIPRRIVSLVPSQTELLFDLGLEEEVVGITKFCVHPESWFRSKARVGGTKQVHVDKVRALQPDLVIANKEENLKEDVDAIRAFCPVWTSDITDISSALEMISGIGEITGRGAEASRIREKIQRGLAAIVPNPRKVVYIIWKDPFMAAGGDTFIHAMLDACGWDNLLAGQRRYPELSLEELKALAPEYVLLSSEPYPFKTKHLEDLSKVLPESKILLVDGEMFSWYGSRMLQFSNYVAEIQLAVSN